MADENDKPHTAFAEAMEKAQEHHSEGGEISRRKPGRPPRTTAGINNATDTYKPSVERNDLDQALQPTGTTDDAVAGATEPFGGKGDHDGDGEPGGNAASKFFPVTLKRNYRPLTDNWRIIRKDGSFGPKPDFDEGTTPKALAGFQIGLPIEEAKKIISLGIAERADAIKL